MIVDSANLNAQKQNSSINADVQAQANEMRAYLEKHTPTEKGGSDLGNLVAPQTPLISNNRGQSYSR
ncbi:MAG: hypothetical protein AB8U25_00010 [Rickettsiales endosymbiont of Dermacentor nuttalli]